MQEPKDPMTAAEVETVVLETGNHQAGVLLTLLAKACPTVLQLRMYLAFSIDSRLFRAKFQREFGFLRFGNRD